MADSNSSSATVVITADPAGLSAGLHTGYIKISAPNSTNKVAANQVNFTVMPQTVISSSPLTNIPITIDGTIFGGGKRGGNWCPR